MPIVKIALVTIFQSYAFFVVIFTENAGVWSSSANICSWRYAASVLCRSRHRVSAC